ncbi:MAG TPA: LuxR C-terminal-related transcriptional regulator [Candidatus Limnocylindrales bacterium]|jgi:LuxR family maltose regulon positive regulatory protein
MLRRARLTSLLRAARPILTLIVAPPGFGKTSLLADWAAADPRTFAWVTIEPQDNDQRVLWTYLGAALAGAIGGSGSVDRFVRFAQDADPAAVVAHELESVDAEIVLVLDDYFLLESDDAHDTVIRFAELAPPNVQVVIATRATPPLPIARLRATGDLVELRAQDLAFTMDETDDFLNGSLELELEPDAVGVLHQRTEGWPAGLYLAYLSMRDSPERLDFVATFGASNRHVIDYLTEQVLMALEPDTLRFMLTTSIVDTICGPLADAITGDTGGAQVLSEMEQANVFITPLDERREWYRYHLLLAELLRLELGRRQPDRIALLHQRAAHWYAAGGDSDRAIRHSIAAGDIDLAARVIGESYLQLLEMGRIATIVGWLAALGPDAIEADRRLGVVSAWTMHFLGRHDEGNAALAAAIRAPGGDPMPDGSASIDSTAALIGAAFPGDDAATMVSSARRAYRFEGDRDTAWRNTVRVMLGFALARVGEFEEAREHLERGGAQAAEAGMWMDAVGARSLLARCELEIGDPARAEAFGREAVEIGEEHGLASTPTQAYARAMLGAILVRRGDPETGGEILARSLPAIRALGEPLAVAESLIALGQARRMTGRVEEANGLLHEADAIIDRARDPGYLVTLRRAAGPGGQTHMAEPLSRRELEVLGELAGGASKREAADHLYVSFNTVHSHVRSIYRKLDVHSMPAAVDAAREQGLIE